MMNDPNYKSPWPMAWKVVLGGIMAASIYMFFTQDAYPSQCVSKSMIEQQVEKFKTKPEFKDVYEFFNYKDEDKEIIVFSHPKKNDFYIIRLTEGCMTATGVLNQSQFNTLVKTLGVENAEES